MQRRLRDDAEPWVDLWQFHQLLAACQQHGHAKDQVCSTCLPLLQQAAELYHNDFLVGFTLTDSPAFDDWQACTTADLRVTFAATLARLVDAYVAQRDYPKAIDQERRWVALDLLYEPAQRRLMELYAHSILQQLLQALAIHNETWQIAHCSFALGSIVYDRGELAQAEQHLNVALAPYQQQGIAGRLADVYRCLGQVMIAYGRDRYREAQQYYHQALELATVHQLAPIAQELQQPFRPSDVYWKPGSVSKEGTKALALPYATLRAYQQRLDTICGAAVGCLAPLHCPCG